MTRLVASLALVLALMAVLGWPASATVREVWRERQAGNAQEISSGSLGIPLWSEPSGAGGAVPRWRVLARETTKLVLATAAIALPLGLPLALVLFRSDVWGRQILIALMLVAMFVPMPLHAAAWLGAFGNVGRSQLFGMGPILVGIPGAAFVHAMAALPWVVILVGVGLRTVERELEESALIDLPAWRVLGRITVRRSLGAIAAAALAVAVLTAGDMTVTDLLRIRTYAEEAYIQYQFGQGPGSAAVATVPPLLVLGPLLVLLAWGLLRLDPARLPSAHARPRIWSLGPWRVPLGVMLLVIVGNVMALPIHGMIWRAGRVGGAAALGQPPQWSLGGLSGTLQNAVEQVALPVVGSYLSQSVFWAAVSASVTVAIAWPLAWLSRSPGPGRWVAVAVVALLLAVPGPVAGMAMVLAYRNINVIYNTAAIVVLAQVARTLPYAVLVLWPALRTIPEAYLESAALDGLGVWGQVRRVALPLSRGAIAASWGVAFVLALGELPATCLVEPPGMTLMPVLVWGLLHIGVESHLAGVGLVMLTAIAAGGLLAAWLLGRAYRQASE